MSVQRTRIVENVTLAPNSSWHMLWREIKDDSSFQVRGFWIRHTAGTNAPTVTYRLRTSIFPPNKTFGAPTDNQSTRSTAILQVSNNTNIAIYPTELLQPVASYSFLLVADNSGTANSTINITEIAVPRGSSASSLIDLGAGREDVPILAGQSISFPVILYGTVVAIRCPVMQASTAFLAVQGSYDGSLFEPIMQLTGDPLVIPVSTTTARWVTIDPYLTTAFRRLRFQAVQADKTTPVVQAAERTLTVLYRGV